MMKRLAWVSFAAVSAVLLGTIVFVTPAGAAEFRGGDVVVLEAGEVVDDDLFVTAERVEIYGTVTGDLFVSGMVVTVDGEVGGSLVIAGQNLNVNGIVEGSLYGAGYALHLGSSAEVDRNVYFAGFSLQAEDGSLVGRGLYMGGYQTLLAGEVARDVSVGTAALELEGDIGGDVVGQVSESDASFTMPFIPSFPGAVVVQAPGLRVGQNARIGGEVDVELIEVEVESTEIDIPSPQRILGLFVLGALRRRAGEFLAVLIVGALLLYLTPGILRRARDEVQERPLLSVGWGCLTSAVFAIGLPLAFGLLILTAVLGGLITFGQLASDILGLGGAALALITTVFFTVIAVVTKAVVAFLIGRAILTRLSPTLDKGFWVDFGALALGMFLYEILRILPVFGWVVAVVVTFTGLGAIYLALRDKLPAPVEPTGASA